MAFTKITEADLQNKGVIGLPDTPGLSTTEMQEKFDEIALDVLTPKHNGLIDELEALSAASNIGAVNIQGTASNVQTELNERYVKSTVDQLLSNKVDVVEGKDLSSNDYTNDDKTKLGGIEANANNYVLPKGTQDTLGGVMGDGTTFTIDENGVGHAVGGGGGTSDYTALVNKPKLNGITVSGDHDSEYYGIVRPYLEITTEAGCTVTISKGGETITATQKSGSTTEWEVYPTSYGTWTISSMLGADEATTTVTIDAVKQYAVTVNHITATITVTYQSGGTCTCTKGTQVYTATSNPQTFTVHSLGDWVVACTYDGITKTQTVSITADEQAESVTLAFATITVTYDDAFRGTTITCTCGVTQYSKTAPSTGNTVAFTVASAGSWVVSGTVGSATYDYTVVVSTMTSYSATLNVFSATVTITFPYSNGASCTLSDGVTTLNANTSPMAFTVPNAGTWVATVTLDGQTKTTSKSITTSGQTESATIEYGSIELTYDNDFRGTNITCANSDNTKVITKTAPSSGNTLYFYPPDTGNWTVSGSVGGTTYASNPNPVVVSSLSTGVSASLQTVVQKTLTIYSAVEDVISYTDIHGATQTIAFATDASSKEVTIDILPTGSSITFTSSIAKNPSSLAYYYSKTVTITTSTSSVYLMPNDNVLYWYGYESNDLEDNGMTESSCTPQALTRNKNNIQVNYSGSYTCSCLNSKNPITGTVNLIAKRTSTYNGYGVNATKAMGNEIIDNQLTETMAKYTVSASSQYFYFGYWNVANRSVDETLYALWYE